MLKFGKILAKRVGEVSIYFFQLNRDFFHQDLVNAAKNFPEAPLVQQGK